MVEWVGAALAQSVSRTVARHRYGGKPDADSSLDEAEHCVFGELIEILVSSTNEGGTS